MSDGTTRTVCKDAAMGCDGAANIRVGGTIDLLLAAPPTGTTIRTVFYGGVGPWMLNEGEWNAQGNSALKCVYPHGPRFGVEACGLANGFGGYDDHQGIGMAAQIFENK